MKIITVMYPFKTTKGFTLIELIVVMAVIAILAGITIAIINPGEQIKRGKDTQRKSIVAQLARSLQSYSVLGGYIGNATPNTQNANWINILINSGELKTAPPDTANSLGECPATTNNGASGQNGYCYRVYASGDVAIWSNMESQLENSKCSTYNGQAYFVWSSAVNKTGVTCSDPSQNWGGHNCGSLSNVEFWQCNDVQGIH